MKRKSSQTFLTEVATRVMNLKRASEETGIDVTDDLIKALGQLSEITKTENSEYVYSDTSEDQEESLPFRQPTNSVLSICSANSQVSLITSIKNKNNELEKSCTKKILELRNTTKEFCTKNRSSSKKSSIEIEENTPNNIEKFETIEIVRQRSKTANSQVSIGSLVPECTLETILEQLSTLKSDLSEATQRIAESNKEILKQNDENSHLKEQIDSILNEHPKPLGISCGCIII